MLCIEIQIQLQNMDAWPSQHAELPCHGVFGNKSVQLGFIYLARATLGILNPAAAWETSGWRPEPDVVTRSMGMANSDSPHAVSQRHSSRDPKLSIGEPEIGRTSPGKDRIVSVPGRRRSEIRDRDRKENDGHDDEYYVSHQNLLSACYEFAA
jgi:hypothetical protein